MREKHQAWIQRIRRFPNLPQWPFVFDCTENTSLPEEVRAEFFSFYVDWGLDRLTTWDWPVPMEPDFIGGARGDLAHCPEAGVSLFLPWHLLRGGMLDSRELLALARLGDVPGHLQSWVNKGPKVRHGDLGDIRYRRVQWIYRYYEQVLRRRYDSACVRNVQVLDHAMAKTLDCSDDAVRKDRLRLERIIRPKPVRP